MKKFKYVTIWDNGDGRVYVFLSDDQERMTLDDHELRCHRNTLQDAIETAQNYVAPVMGKINQLLQAERKHKYRTIKEFGKRWLS